MAARAREHQPPHTEGRGSRRSPRRSRSPGRPPSRAHTHTFFRSRCQRSIRARWQMLPTRGPSSPSGRRRATQSRPSEDMTPPAHADAACPAVRALPAPRRHRSTARANRGAPTRIPLLRRARRAGSRAEVASGRVQRGRRDRSTRRTPECRSDGRACTCASPPPLSEPGQRASR